MESVYVIGVDENGESERAFQFYAENIHRTCNRLIMVHAVEPRIMSSNLPFHLVGKVREQMKAEESKKIKRLQEKYEDAMRSNGVQGKINVVYYSLQPGKIICEVASQENCIMIILGNPSNPKISTLGSTIDYVLKKAKCPVLITRRPTTVDPTAQNVTVLPFEIPRRRLGSWSAANTPTRRISCPAAPTLHAPVADCDPPVEKDLKQRRHSTIVNPFRQLTLANSQSPKLVGTAEEAVETTVSAQLLPTTTTTTASKLI